MKHLRYVSNLIGFAFKANPLLYFSIVLSLISVCVELLAMVSLLPLFQIAATGKAVQGSMIERVLSVFGLDATASVLLWTFVVLLTLRIVTQLAGQSLSMFLGKRVLAQLSSRAFYQIVTKLSIQEIHDKSIGFFIGVAGDEAFRASTLVISLTQFVSTASLAVLYFVAIAAASKPVALLVLIFLVGSSLVLIAVLKLSHRLGGHQTTAQRQSHSVFLDSLNNIKAVRTFSAEKYVAGVYRSVIYRYTTVLFLIDEIALLAKLVPVLLLLTIFAVWLLITNGSMEQLGLAFIVTTIVYLMRFFPTVGDGAHLLFKIVSDAKSGKDVTTLLTTHDGESPSACTDVGEIRKIELQHVCFSYLNTERTILSDINSIFEKGKSYALIGPSGVGKSTLVDVLLKFYPPTSGTVLVNDFPLTDVADAAVRKRIILVPQDAAIFDDTIANNIRLGHQAPLSDVEKACEQACMQQTILDMPNGYESRLQYQGKNLSGGQRQRIAISRALLRKPDVLILDESTSALDKHTQTQVVENILREYRDRIVLFVTHDPYIIAQVDEVIDMRQINGAVQFVANEPAQLVN